MWKGRYQPRNAHNFSKVMAENGFSLKTSRKARCQWLMPLILATQEAEITRIKV
jgi:hypothetical protein